MELVHVPINQITVDAERRPPGDITDLTRSIREVGLFSPIIVDSAFRLLAGARRLAACQALGLSEVPAFVSSLDALGQELTTLEENLCQSPLSVLERAMALGRAKEIYEIRHPETRSVNVKGGPGSGHIREQETSDSMTPVFTKAVAKRMRKSRRTVERLIELDHELNPTVKRSLRDHRVANSLTELQQLSRLPPEAQQCVAQVLTTGERKSVKGATSMMQFLNARKDAPAGDDRYRVDHGDFATFLNGLEPESVDLVVTDPPWTDFQRWGELIECVARVLRSTGALAAFCGQDHLHRLYASLSDRLTPRWQFTCLRPQRMQQAWQARIISGYLPIVYATKSPQLSRDFICDIIEDPPRRKVRRAMWEKDQHTFSELIVRLSDPGHLVCDPFLGTGASGVAALRNARRYVGADVDERCVDYARTRLAEVKWADPACEPGEKVRDGTIEAWEETR